MDMYSPRPFPRAGGSMNKFTSLLRKPGELGQLVTHALVHRVRYLLMTLSCSSFTPASWDQIPK